MKKYAIIKFQGKQYHVSEGDLLTVDRVSQKVDDKITVSDVLLLKNGDKVKVGQPLVKDSSVTMKVSKHYRDKKIRVFKFKSKSRYRRVKGHKQHKSDLEVLKVS